MTTSDYRLIDSPYGTGKVLIPHGQWRPEFSSLMKSEGLRGIRLTYSYAWKGPSLDFLSEFPDLEELFVVQPDVRDASVVSNLRNLRVLGLHCRLRKLPDLGQLPELRRLWLSWCDGLEEAFARGGALENSKLEELKLDRWPYSDLKKLRCVTTLKSLWLTAQRLESLEGIEELVRLEELRLSFCPKLRDLGRLDRCASLETLELYSCNRIGDISSIGRLGALRQLRIECCGPISSLEPLTRCISLEGLNFDGTTRVLDGKTSTLRQLPRLKYAVFRPRRNYDMKPRDFVSPSSEGT